MRRIAKDRATVRGYTIVELMMALAVLAIGVTGIAAMQKVTAMANRHAKNLSIANHIAQAWQEQLAADAGSWNHPSVRNPTSDLNDTVWLKQIAVDEGTWFRPAYDSDLRFGPAFDALGNVTAIPAQAVFCTHVRLRWLYRDNQPTIGNGLIRAEVRVFWRREGEPHVVESPFCGGDGESAELIGDSFDSYHFVYDSSAVRQHTAQ